ncbi:unnamed protein product [Lampetra planeri]
MLLLLLLLPALPSARAAGNEPSLLPPYFNVAERASASATATCGQDEEGRSREDTSCALSGSAALSGQGNLCEICSLDDPDSAHPVSNAIDGTERSWQSPPLSRGPHYNHVNVTLNLGQLFHVGHITVKFANSPRPSVWLLERSADFGHTYSPWQYFAPTEQECQRRFGVAADERVSRDDDVTCSTQHSGIVPLENGEVVVSLMGGRPGATDNSISPALRNFTTASHVRLRLLQTGTLPGHLLAKAHQDPTVTRRYFYSIKEISVGGRCMCHGHADSCRARNPANPYRLQCECRHGTCGDSCERCCPGMQQRPWSPSGPDGANACEPCNCHGHSDECVYDAEVDALRASMNASGGYSGGGLCLNCQHHTYGINCERCEPGYYRPTGVSRESPDACRPCACSGGNLASTCEDGSGHCHCAPGFRGDTCNRCVEGHGRYPACRRDEACALTLPPPLPRVAGCACDPFGAVAEDCSGQGQCRCRPNFVGLRCEACARGFYAFPSCMPCDCDVRGSFSGECDAASGACSCRAGVSGRRCDACASGTYGFPACQGECALRVACRTVRAVLLSQAGCRCRENVQGASCGVCKPLHWDLRESHPQGCRSCQCDREGALSGLAECTQETGQCPCKPHADSRTCGRCQEGFFALKASSYLGCQACGCDLGGSLGSGCDAGTGACRCKKGVSGRSCSSPRQGYYFPGLERLHVELEDGRTPTGDPPRFGFDGAEFANFSGRGYVKMSPLQEVVQVDVELGSSTLDLYVVALSYVSALDVPVTGRVTVTPRGPQGASARPPTTTTVAANRAGFPPVESTLIAPPPSSAPPPPSLSPQDHALLLPSAGALAESPVLRQAASDPCSVSPTAAQRAQLCLHYLYLPLEGFAGVRGIEGTYHGTGKHRSPSQGRKATHRHPVMADVSHKQQSLYLAVRAPEAGRYSLLLEYSSEAESESVQEARVSVRDAGGVQQSLKASVQILPCNYSFLCRAVALDPSGGVASYDLPEQAELHLTGSGLNFLLYKVHLIPVHKFSAALLEPRVHCVSRHGTYSPTGSVSSKQPSPLRASMQCHRSGEATSMLRCRVQNQIRMIVRVEKSGRHVFLLHYFQPRQPSVHTKAALDASTWSWHGSFNATFCPHAYGCRGVVAFESQLGVDLREGQEVSITLTNPSGEALWLAYVLAVPESLFTPSVLREEPVDRSRDFVTLCGANGFSMRGDSVPEFCRAAASSLSALADDDGARRCGCDAAGSLPGPCRPLGGQCPCRPGVVGRSCDRCAAAHHGFPECRPCQCGGRLCDERTGECVCPPRTVRPDCTACQRLTFGFHPLAGCRPCECEDQGLAKAGCDRETGQCRCKPNVGGQRCEHCLPGFFGYPECRPCDCDAAGVSGAGCDAVTGQCLCKENVQGRRCDVCRVGTFDLGAENPKGCTACFCFGVTGECTSSKLRRETIANMSGWRLLMGSGGGEEESVQVKHDETARKAEAALSKRHMDAELEPYWAAPQAYLGDQLSSYGGELSYRVRASGGQDGHRTPPGDHQQPDLILRGSHMSLVHRAERQPVVGETFHGSVRLLEDGFQHGASGRPASREELAMVLQDLQALLLRGRTRPGPSRLTLSHVVMETASANASGPLARGVERCLCPASYRGGSCQECARGHYRDSRGSFLGRCLPCDCNGHSDECQDETGICIHCDHNTRGDHCELCREGCLPRDVQGDEPTSQCFPCPCPMTIRSNHFAIGCVQKPEGLECLCREGYEGKNCERCAPGYFGNPMVIGSECKACQCNGNAADDSGSPGVPGGSCDPVTGQCRQCRPHTAGPRCQDCEQGYYGDAVFAKNCTVCDGCVLTLLNDMDGAGKSLSDIKSILKGVSISTVTTVRLNKLNSSLLQAQKDLSRYKKSVTDQKKKVDVMETDTMDFQMDINALKEQVDSGARRVKALEASLERTHKRGGSVSKTVDSVVRFIQELISKAGAGPSGLPLPAEEFQRKLAEAESLVREMRNRNFDKMQDVADEEKRLAEDLMSRVRKEFSKPLKDLASRASVAHDNLEKYDRVLADLLESINAARNLTNHANTLNKANQAALDRNQQKVKDVRQAAGEANKSLSDAENVLGQAYQMIQLLEASRVEYEKLSAEVDGAKNLLRDKVEKMAEGAAQEPLVRRAEEHAKRLQELADNLKRLLKDIDQNEYIQKAILASKAYEDIIKALKETEEAADQALQAALKAEQDVQRENLPKKAADSKKASETLKKDIEDKQGTIKDLDKKLQGVKDTVNTAKDKLKALTDALQRAKQDLAMVNRGNIDEVLRKAKEDAQAAGDLAMSTENEANSILEEAKKLAEKIKSGAVDSQGFQLAFIEATKKVNDLTDLVPELLKKLAELEGKNISADVAGNLSNIREIIEAARHSASLAKVPMKFNGTSGVNVRLGSPLEELRPYTSVALYLLDADPARGDDTTGDDSRFLFYLGKKTDLGDYIGAFLERKKVVFVYNLGIGDTFLRFPEPDAIINPKAFTYVRFERIYEHAQAEFRQDKRIFKTMSVASRKDYLLDLDPANTVLYVGGAPAGAQLPAALSLPNFVGNLELAAINENITSLYNFEKTYFMNTVTDYPAKRYKDSPEVNPQTYYFDGTGYAEAPVDASGGRYNFDFNIRTSMDDGILLFMEKDNKFMCLSIYNGQLHFVFDFGAGPVVPKTPGCSVTFSPGALHTPLQVQLNVLQLVSKVSLNVGPKSERLFFDVFSPEIQSLWSVVGNTAYIGGVPKGRIPDSIKQYLPVQTSYKGCMKALKVMTSAIALKQIPTSGIIYGCYDNFMVSRGADFTGTGYLSFQPEGFDATDFECGLTFKTTSPSGLLMGSVDRDLQISMVGAGIVQLKLGTITIRSASNGFNDGLPHYVKVTRQGNTVRMAVDNKYEPDKETARRRRASRQAPSQLYFLGGYVEASASRFNGCIANVYIRRPGEEHVEDLHNFVEKLDASLDGCVGSLLAAP